MRNPVGSFFGFGNNMLCRAVNEMRRGAPIVLRHDASYVLAFACELLDQQTLSVFTSFSRDACILLTAHRAALVSSCDALSRVNVGSMSIQDVYSILSGAPSSVSASIEAFPSSNLLDKFAIDLVKMAKFLPSALVVDMDFADEIAMGEWCSDNDILHFDCSMLAGYTQQYSLREVCRSDLHLQDSLTSKIVVYRSNIGEPEHYAVIIGTPNMDNPVVRLHSSCYTGDLLGSLACDCRGQLLTSVKLMGSQEGGVILYISQEGRGIGLANKIRAYNLQANHALDTVDANRFLGFEDDERVFLPAACILNMLGVTNLQLLTSNPNKVQAICRYGFNVTNTIPLITEPNKYNGHYIKTKQTRLGHGS
ncbi:GTP cyclohydrolase II [Candidatus Anaplasma sp. TIGMIC]|uniref:GTP cyclohydrolase II n=1 Tax=Candidatus Anaplasma sp. TIGMIC TaxID=3020713 RepID=UPI00232C7C56|nr:GTP cyclohydrolase II [Candidatus Anaplasma sp. TIGMIC]MDB1135493.1 GTP cyclohydrolase II [Candidatus Anaplasma sp. TIGMIC]